MRQQWVLFFIISAAYWHLKAHSLNFCWSARLGTVRGNNVDVTAGVLKGIWLCRFPGAHQLAWVFRGDWRHQSRRSRFRLFTVGGALNPRIQRQPSTPGRFILGQTWLGLKRRASRPLLCCMQPCCISWPVNNILPLPKKNGHPTKRLADNSSVAFT